MVMHQMLPTTNTATEVEKPDVPPVGEPIHILNTNDGVKQPVTQRFIESSGLLVAMKVDCDVKDGFPVGNIPSAIIATLSKLLAITPPRDPQPSGAKRQQAITLIKEETAFLASIDPRILCIMMKVANFLDNKELLTVMTQYIANELAKISIEDLKECFKVSEPLKPEEETKLRKDILGL
jgi:hypothetical protein